MGGIFINYRREDSAPWAGRLYERLARVFPRNQLLFDVDAIEPGLDFVRVLEELVSGCDVLVAIIGLSWVEARNEEGLRRLDDPEDFVRIELDSALKRDIRVIPVLVDGARMPRAEELPEPLKPLVRRNAIRVSHEHFGADTRGLVEVLPRLMAPPARFWGIYGKPAMPWSPSSSTRQQVGRDEVVSSATGNAKSRTPLVFASVFALASLPIALGMALLFGQNNWSWFGPGFYSTIMSGVLTGVILLVVSALALVRWRGAEITGTEIALYWLGLSLAVTFAMGRLFDALNWEISSGLLTGAMLAAFSAVILLALWRRRSAA